MLEIFFHEGGDGHGEWSEVSNANAHSNSRNVTEMQCTMQEEIYFEKFFFYFITVQFPSSEENIIEVPAV
jgi:hypothetical protein